MARSGDNRFKEGPTEAPTISRVQRAEALANEAASKSPVALSNEDGELALELRDETRLQTELPAGAGVARSVAIDVGSVPVDSATVIVSDMSVNPASIIVVSVSADTPPGKDDDEVAMDALAVKAEAGVGQVSITITGLEGPIHDKFVINYTVT